ncbi:MAG: hypothetical protein COA79_20870 [Planctomycetota bacterium]|nr:MAG: hypothetical protein COA79_20870 [Planctomycetota bacterium]
MKLFLIKICIFCLLFISVTSLLIAFVIYREKNRTSLIIPLDKTILLIGDSHPACSVNDSILKNTFNLSKGGTTYFETYLKLKRVLETNKNINTVILGYSYGDLSKYRDKWIKDPAKAKKLFTSWLYLFDLQLFLSYLYENPSGTLINFPKSIRYGMNSMLHSRPKENKISEFGGYHKLNGSKLRIAKEKFLIRDKSFDLKVSEFQLKYLIKIYKLVLAKNKKLILLNTPIHPIAEKDHAPLKPFYFSVVKDKLPKAALINHSNMYLPEEYFSDLDHLNFKGAKFYSEWLLKFGYVNLNSSNKP